MWPEGLPPSWPVQSSVDLLHAGLSVLRQAFCLVCCQLDFPIGISEKTDPLPVESLCYLCDWCWAVCTLLCPALYSQHTLPALLFSGGLVILSSASSDGYGFWKVWVCVLHIWVVPPGLVWTCVMCHSDVRFISVGVMDVCWCLCGLSVWPSRLVEHFYTINSGSSQHRNIWYLRFNIDTYISNETNLVMSKGHFRFSDRFMTV